MLVHKDEPGFTTEPKGALFVCPARISHIEDFGGTTKRIPIPSGRVVPASLALRNFNWTMSIDNRGASDQLKPGTYAWLSSLYPARELDKITSLDDPHRRSS